MSSECVKRALSSQFVADRAVCRTLGVVDSTEFIVRLLPSTILWESSVLFSDVNVSKLWLSSKFLFDVTEPNLGWVGSGNLP